MTDIEKHENEWERQARLADERAERQVVAFERQADLAAAEVQWALERRAVLAEREDTEYLHALERRAVVYPAQELADAERSEYHRAWVKHAANVDQTNERMATALERIAEALAR